MLESLSTKERPDASGKNLSAVMANLGVVRNDGPVAFVVVDELESERSSARFAGKPRTKF